MTDADFVAWEIIVGLGGATFMIRYWPLAFLSRADLPGWLKRALRYVPPAVMAAIITPPLFFIGTAPTIGPDLPRLTAAALAVLVAWRTRSTLLTIVLGMLALWTLQALSS
ncbi:MAG: AzlD domain-containing protein [Candidatus Accumulibacter sp.]|nr:AzlD domain-containing protein [Accumulibacter sp.]